MLTFAVVFAILAFPAPSTPSPEACGTMSQAASLINNGDFSWRNEFPWMAIISRRDEGAWTHQGSGSLISDKHIITHALAVSFVNASTQRLQPIASRRVRVFLGTTKYNDLSEQGSLHVRVASIAVHPNAAKVIGSLSVKKLAIVALVNRVNVTEFIRPVCLWSFSHNVEDVMGSDAYAVGYGVNQRGRDTRTRKYARMTVTSFAECEQTYDRELKFSNLTSFFCAIGKGNDGPCRKDSQLFFKVGSSWYLRGVLSTVIYLENGSCHTKRPALFEDIVGSNEWIQRVISEGDASDGLAEISRR